MLPCHLSCSSLCHRVSIRENGIRVFKDFRNFFRAWYIFCSTCLVHVNFDIFVVSLTGIWIWSSFRLPAFNCCSSNSALCSYQQWWVKQKQWIFNGLMDWEWSNWICVLHIFLPCHYNKCVFSTFSLHLSIYYIQSLLNQCFCVSLPSIILADLSGNKSLL